MKFGTGFGALRLCCFGSVHTVHTLPFALIVVIVVVALVLEIGGGVLQFGTGFALHFYLIGNAHTVPHAALCTGCGDKLAMGVGCRWRPVS